MRSVMAVILVAGVMGCNLPSFPSKDQGGPSPVDVVDGGPQADAFEAGYDPSPPRDTGDSGNPTVPDGVDAIVAWDPGCEPNCWTKVCGPDDCGGSCGTCPDGTVCSYDGGMCISKEVQAPMGGGCGQAGDCEPYVETSIYTYPNPSWPGCLNDQCLEGPCLSWVCSRQCEVVKDTVINGSSDAVPDGIEDADSPSTACDGGLDGLFDGGFACVETAPEWEDDPVGLCFPKSSFAKCVSSDDCPGGEACGFLLVRGFEEARCLAVPKGSGGISDACGFDKITGKTMTCEAWACGEHGCTGACGLDDHCLTKGAHCDPVEGTCADGGSPCAGDSDCSAWVCGEDAVLSDPAGVFTACAPRECESDAACRDQGYYCRHEKAEVNDAGAVARGMCAARQEGGAALGGFCDETKGNGVPDVVCADLAYCLDHTCGSMCGGDEDCAAGGLMGCGFVEFEGGPDPFGMQPVPFDVPVCQWIGGPGNACSHQTECAGGVCTPWVPVENSGIPAVETACMEPPMGSLGIGQRCGAAAWGQECDTRRCLLEDTAQNVPGYCSTVCRTRDDCPGQTPVGSEVVKWVCDSLVFNQMGTTLVADDLWVSWCLPVPSSSSLDPCDEAMKCSKAGEACRALVRAGQPNPGVDYLCVDPGEGKADGESCDPAMAGKDCRSGSCATTTLSGVGFCTRLCATDAQCHDLGGGGASCADRVVVPLQPPMESISIRECRVEAECVQCLDGRDCGNGFECVDLSAVPFQQDFRCIRSCETDDDCFGTGDGVLCTDLPSPFETAPGGTARACAPIACPG